MKSSSLDSHAPDLILRARQNYTQRMLQLYLSSKSVRVSQSTISRWLCKSGVYHLLPLPPDEEYYFYQKRAQTFLQRRCYRRSLAKWGDHIWYMRSRGASLPQIQDDLRRRGVVASTKAIHRELKKGAE